MLVDMERSYITAGFFRYTMYRRFEASQSQAAVQKALAKGGKKKGFMDRVGLGGGGSDADAGVPGAPDAAGAMVPRAPGAPGGAAAGGGISLGSLADPNDYIAAHFDKKVNEESARQSLPVDGWRWQKRFFIFSGEALLLEAYGEFAAEACRVRGERVSQRLQDMPAI
jgi:dynamin GTPase